MTFRAGEFNVQRIGRALRPFCPVSAFHSLESIPLKGLHERGKKLILLDVDNTLVRWKGEDFTPEVLAWIEEAKGLGFHLCILSNTRRPKRLDRLADKLGIRTIRDRFKPSRRMYRLAMLEFRVTPDETVMVGDQILTDILGANRCGIEGIWVHRIHEREFVGTRANRLLERIVVALLYKAMPVIEAMPEDTGTRETLAQQFIKFGVVGGTSTVIDYGLFFIFYRSPISLIVGTPLFLHGISLGARDPRHASVPVIQAVATGVAIINSFYWNRKWTFNIRDDEGKGEQFRRFVILSVSVLVLTAVTVTLLTHVMSILAAKIVATVLMAFVNFGGQRLWAFKKH